MSRYHVLATCQMKPIFLVTPYGPNYISELHLKQISGSKNTQLLAKVNMKYVMIRKPRFHLFGGNFDIVGSLFDAIQSLRSQYMCTQEFKINSEGNIAIASFLPSGFILSIYLLQGYELKTDSKLGLAEVITQYVAVEVNVK